MSLERAVRAKVRNWNKWKLEWINIYEKKTKFVRCVNENKTIKTTTTTKNSALQFWLHGGVWWKWKSAEIFLSKTKKWKLNFEFSYSQIAGKRDPVKDKEAQEWIQDFLGFKFPAGQSYEDALKDGVILCKLINKIKPGSVSKINEGGATFKLMENINNFQVALKKYGIPDIDVFQTVDLFEKKDIGQGKYAKSLDLVSVLGHSFPFPFFFFLDNIK